MAESLESKLYERVLGPYTKENGRQIVVVKDNGRWKTISYPKYLMHEELGRELDPETETLDHIDGDFNNNDVSNFRLVDRRSHSSADTRRVKLITLICDGCGKQFERSPRQIRISASLRHRGVFCGKSCAGRYGRLLHLGLVKKKKRVKPVKSEYYTHHHDGEIE